MAGLALGSAIAASAKLRWIRVLHLYALLELAVALSGCTLVFGIPLLGENLHFLFQALWSDHALLNGLRFFLSFLILLVPTTAMGLTLPVLLEDSILRDKEFGRALGLLYGWNTLGAVVGALIGETYLVKAFGLGGTALAADRDPSILFIVSNSSSSERPKRQLHSILDPDGSARARANVSYRLPFRNFVSLHHGTRSDKCGKPDELCWSNYLVQYQWCYGRTTAGELRVNSQHWISMDSDIVRRRLMLFSPRWPASDRLGRRGDRSE